MNKKRKIKQNLQAYSFLLPNLILFIVCTLYPVVWALKYVFYQMYCYLTMLFLFFLQCICHKIGLSDKQWCINNDIARKYSKKHL